MPAPGPRQPRMHFLSLWRCLFWPRDRKRAIQYVAFRARLNSCPSSTSFHPSVTGWSSVKCSSRHVTSLVKILQWLLVGFRIVFILFRTWLLPLPPASRFSAFPLFPFSLLLLSFPDILYCVTPPPLCPCSVLCLEHTSLTYLSDDHSPLNTRPAQEACSDPH